MSSARSPRPVVSITVGTSKLDDIVNLLCVFVIHFSDVQSSSEPSDFSQLLLDPAPPPVTSPGCPTHSTGQHPPSPLPVHPQSAHDTPNVKVQQPPVRTPLAHVCY